jgi:hypothetical protein
MIRFALLFLLGATCVAAGCSSEPPQPKRYPVSGTVTLDGQPLEKGSIFFKKVSEGAIDEIEIKDGKFSGQAQEGDCRVEVNSFDVQIIDPQGMKSEVKTNKVAPQFNSQSTLTAKVTASGPNEFKFDVTSK